MLGWWRRWFATTAAKQTIQNFVPGYPPIRQYVLKSVFGGNLAEVENTYKKLEAAGLSPK
jgi:hypothetical protein